MAVLYHLPILHASVGSKDPRAALIDPWVRIELARITREYFEILIPSFFDQLREDGLLNRKKKFLKPVHMFLDGVWRPGHELLQHVRASRSHEESPMYELVTRLQAAGAVLQKTELACLLGRTLWSPGEDIKAAEERRTRIDFLRELYIASRVRRTLLQKDAIGILILGGAHKRLNLPENIQTLVYHRADICERSTLKAINREMTSPLFEPDDFGHILSAFD